ncbi:MAG: hypothetical protein QNK42_01295 [Pseudodonghicola sp.]|nr:hypothetical protein [Pseudodonghicola sp.]
MTRLALLFVLFTLPADTGAKADVIGPGGLVRDCYCTDSTGGRVELGETICLHVDGRMFMAQCQMSLNVPMWREVQQGCLSSRLDLHELSKPAFGTGLVYPKI